MTDGWIEDQSWPTESTQFYNSNQNDRQNSYRNNSQRRGGRGGGDRNSRQFSRNKSDYANNDRDDSSEIMKVPSSCVGRIIGKFWCSLRFLHW